MKRKIGVQVSLIAFDVGMNDIDEDLGIQRFVGLPVGIGVQSFEYSERFQKAVRCY